MWNGSSWSTGVTQIDSSGYIGTASIDSSNNMYMIYRVNDGTYAYLYFRKWSGSSWGSNVEITKTNRDYSETPTACSVITDSAGSVYCIYYYNYYSTASKAYCCYKNLLMEEQVLALYIKAPPNTSSQFIGKALNYGDARYLPSVGFAYIYHWNEDYEAYIYLSDGLVWEAVAPTVTTQSATNVAQTSCTGNITATGNATVGFCYKVGT